MRSSKGSIMKHEQTFVVHLRIKVRNDELNMEKKLTEAKMTKLIKNALVNLGEVSIGDVIDWTDKVSQGK